MGARRSSAPLRIVPSGPVGLDGPDRKDAPIFIGPDYARILARDWGSLHARGDRRAPIDIAPGHGRWRGTDARRFER